MVLSATQFLMVLDQSVMNVSISQLVDDFDTDVSSIQGVITLYSLVMAALMITGGKIGDIVGRRRALRIGLVIYAAGSALTALAWSVPSLALGWSVLEGVGAALVMPAMAALVAGNYAGRARVVAYGVLGGTAGAGIAIGPILGGFATTNLTWRVVFVGEVMVAIGILAASSWVADAPRADRKPKLDVVGAVLSAVGISICVLGILQASTWGWLTPVNSPVEPFGFAATPFVVAIGVAILSLFRLWQAHRERVGRDPLVRFQLFSIPTFRSGLTTFLAQNTILMGIFFTIPLFLQIVIGLDALETGIRMLPTSIAMLITSFSGGLLLRYLSPRSIVRIGLVLVVLAASILMGTIGPMLDGLAFGIGMGLLGAAMGLIASQLGNIVLSSVDPESRSEAGGLQYTAQQLGSSVGVALIGAIVLTSLAGLFAARIADDERIPAELTAAVELRLASGSSFVPSRTVEELATAAGVPVDEVTALVESYEESQLAALRTGLLAVAAIGSLSMLATGGLPARRPDDGHPPDQRSKHVATN
ncbi:MAG: MFS transporter [Ilumatobacter sp.]|nr:MAG: MFS transporter [Ilumatobacter sp.]